jgi:hypothetical protein
VGLGELLAEARRIDQAHRLQHRRPVSAETLRKQMRIGSMRARALVREVRGSRDPAGQEIEASMSASQQMGGVHSCGEGNHANSQLADSAGDLAVAS